MGVDFSESFIPSLFFITKQAAIAISAVTIDDRAPLTNTDNNTASGHDKKAPHQTSISFTTHAGLNFELIRSL